MKKILLIGLLLIAAMELAIAPTPVIFDYNANHPFLSGRADSFTINP